MRGGSRGASVGSAALGSAPSQVRTGRKTGPAAPHPPDLVDLFPVSAKRLTTALSGF